MRYFFPLLFLMLVASQSMQGVIVMLEWKINQKEIIQKFCENKDKPKLKCNGKCHLVKQLKKQEQDERSNGGKKDSEKNKKAKEHFQEYLAKNQKISFAIVDEKGCQIVTPYKIHFSVYTKLDVFRPPIFS